METKPLVSVINPTFNGIGYIANTLGSLRDQTYENVEVVIWDNASSDRTLDIIREQFPSFKLIENKENIGIWAAFEHAVSRSNGKYVVLMSDVILDPDFLKIAVEIMERNERIGALQAKILQHIPGKQKIDTCGFKIFRSRRVVNIGQGEIDRGQYECEGEIFAVEGAVPIFRRDALEQSKIDGHVVDPDYRIGPLGYGDDFDLTWRMRLLGWKQWYSPRVIAYHNRSTTRDTARSFVDYFRRIKLRKQIPIQKRRNDWLNIRFTIIKNDYIMNIVRDLPYIVLREAAVFLYTLFVEPSVLLSVGRFLRLLPRMLDRRHQIMKRAKSSAAEMRFWENTYIHEI